jgi:chorismate mutase
MTAMAVTDNSAASSNPTADVPATTTTTVQPLLSQPATDADAQIGVIRERIDEIDAAIMSLWQERAALSQRVGATRVAAGGTRLVLSRERQILDKYRDALGSDGTQLALLVLRAGRGPL